MNAVHAGGLGGTYGGNPVAAAAALAAIGVMRDEALAERAGAISTTIERYLSALATEFPAVAEVRGRGAMMAMELVRPGSLEPDAALAKAVVAWCADQGVITLSCGTYGNVVRILVPLTASDAVIDEGLDIIAACLAATGA